jgi:hypothetical protein
MRSGSGRVRMSWLRRQLQEGPFRGFCLLKSTSMNLWWHSSLGERRTLEPTKSVPGWPGGLESCSALVQSRSTDLGSRAPWLEQGRTRFANWQDSECHPELLRRVFRVEIFTCPNCGGARRLLAAIKDPDSIERRQSAPRQAGRVGAAGDGAAVRGAGVGGGAGSAGRRG